MIRKILSFLSMWWLTCSLLMAAPTEITATNGIVEIPDKDGPYSITVEGTLTLRMKSTTYSYKDCGVVFTPANEGDIIIATVQNVNLPSGAALLIYDDNIAAMVDADKFARSGSSTGSYRYFSDGWVRAFDAPTAEKTIFQSKDAEGKLAIGLHTSSWTSGHDFLVTITSGVPKDMEYVSTTMRAGENIHRGAANACIASVSVFTEGLNAPLSVNNISAAVSSLLNAGVENIKLYSGRNASADHLLAQEAGGLLSWSGSAQLSSGNNYFTIAGDIPADFVGDLTLPSDVSVSIDNNLYSAEIDASTLPVEDAIYISASQVIYTISENTKFYDDGGPSGKISEGFNGIVTFVPATEGSKIRIDFDKLALFYNSSAVSVGNQDVFKFYNGRTADEENLIATITDKAKIIKSTADDGSLTVTFASKTAYPTDGWEAMVSEFIPGDMTVSSVEATVEPDASASAYESDVKIATLNVRAVNTMNPLTPANIKLNLEGVSDVEKITVYELGEENVFSTKNAAGTSTTLSEGENIIELSVNPLSEGSNYYAVAIDVNFSALNGDEIKVTPVEMLISGNTYTMDSPAQAKVTVANRYSHKPGSDVREIHDVWEFVSTPDNIYSSKYKLENADCQVTFVPATEGAVAILDFSEFDVYYSSSTYYGARAKFEVYSGRTPDAANLLWKLDSNGGKPAGKLKSDAEDGSITVCFNANTTTSSYGGSGWKATVTPFINHDMEVMSVSVAQPVTGSIMPGAVSDNILELNVNTEGTLDSRKLKSVTVDLKGSAAAVSRVSLKANGEEIGSAAVGSDDEQVSVACDYTLQEEDNVISVAYDIASDVEPDVVIDGKIVKITTDKGEIEVANGDPEGNRTAKYQFVMSNGNHTVIVSGSIHFYDDGGEDGILSKDGLNGSVTFVPADPTKKIRATVVNYYTAATSILDFYSGTDVANVSLGQCKQRTFPELPMVSKADDGAMYVKVACQSYSYSEYSGWDIIIEQYEPSDLYIDEVYVENVAAEKTVRGAIDTPVSKVIVKAEGDASTIGVSKLNATITATDLADVCSLSLWYTAKSEGFAPTNLIATAVPDENGAVSFEIADPKLAEELGSYFYWITATVSADAAVDNTITIKVEGITDTKNYTIAANVNEQSTMIKAGFAGGEFVIGASEEADYHSFAEAIAIMGDAIEGPVTFLVEPGTYAEDIYVDGIKGASETNKITFKSMSDIAADVILSGKGFVDGGYGSAKYGIFNVKNTDWVCIDHLTFNGKVSGSTQYPYYVNYVEASRHNKLSNCAFTAETATSYSGINFVYLTCSDPVENGKNADFLTITGNSFTGGYVAIYAQGSNGYIKNDRVKGLVVADNTFTDIGSKCVYPYQVEDLQVSGNTFTASTAVTKTSYYAIDMVRCSGDIDIFNNRIVNNQTVYSSGMYVRDDCHGTAERPIRIYNNSIAVTAAPSTSSTGITITTECEYIDLAFNTINIEGAAGIGISVSNTKDALKHIALRNNLVHVDVTGETSMAFNLNHEPALSAFSFANNAFYSSAKLSNLADDADTWVSKTADNSLIVEKPAFFASADLHLADAGSLVNAIPVEHVTHDIDGNPRAAVPTIGAYEYVALSADKPLMAEGYPKVDRIRYNSAYLTTQWSEGGVMHYVVAKVSDEEPAEDTILQATGVNAVANQDLSVSLSALDEATGYRVYMILEGVNGVNSDIETAEFTTARYIAPLSVYLDEEQAEYDVDDDVVITPEISGGDAPYTYSWKNQMGDEVGTDESLSLVAETPGIYTLDVTSADGQKASAFTALPVYGASGDATFEDLKLQPESYWYGTQDEDIPSYQFYSGAFSFSNYCMPDYNYWGGFSYANCTDTQFESLFPGQFCNPAGGGFESSNYAMAYTNGIQCVIEVMKDRGGAELGHVYVNNSAYAINNMTYGDSFSEAFSDGDYHKVIFTGDDPQGTPVEFYLADYRNGNSEMVKDWKKVNLAPLGKHVTKIRVITESSNTGVPAYVALDNLAYADTLGSGVANINTNNASAENVVGIRIISLNGSILHKIDNAYRLVEVSDFINLPGGIFLIEYTLSDGNIVTSKYAVK